MNLKIEIVKDVEVALALDRRAPLAKRKCWLHTRTQRSTDRALQPHDG